MITREKLEAAYAARRAAALEYVQSLPQERINLDVFIESDEFDTEKFARTRRPIEIREMHLLAAGLEHIPCGSIACLAGWLVTMPRYRAWEQQQFPHHRTLSVVGIMDRLAWFLGCDVQKAQQYYFSLLFEDERKLVRQGVLTQKQIAIARIEQLQYEPYRHYAAMEIGNAEVDNNEECVLSATTHRG